MVCSHIVGVVHPGRLPLRDVVERRGNQQIHRENWEHVEKTRGLRSERCMGLKEGKQDYVVGSRNRKQAADGSNPSWLSAALAGAGGPAVGAR